MTYTRTHLLSMHIYYAYIHAYIHNEGKKNKFYVIRMFSYITAAINHITRVRYQLTTTYFVPRQTIQNNNLENVLLVNANGIDAERCQSITTIVT